MFGSDEGLKAEFLGVPGSRTEARGERKPCGEFVVMPSSAILVGEGHQPAGLHASMSAGVLQQQQREKRTRSGRVGRQTLQQGGQAYSITARGGQHADTSKTQREDFQSATTEDYDMARDNHLPRPPDEQPMNSFNSTHSKASSDSGLSTFRSIRFGS